MKEEEAQVQMSWQGFWIFLPMDLFSFYFLNDLDFLDIFLEVGILLQGHNLTEIPN